MSSGTRRAVVKGTGGFLPDRVVTNEEMSKIVDTSDEWITARTGIKERRFAADDQTTSDLAIGAAEKALQKAGLKGDDIDLIVLATATPDNTFPATATKVQHALGATGAAFDVQAVCTGFVYATATANNFISMGQADRALVIGAETFSRILDFEDRTTCVLFGDGAGAMVLEAHEGDGGADDRGVLASKLHSDGQHHDLLYVDGGVSSTGTIGHLRMEGPEVFKHAVTNLAGVTTEVLDQLGLGADAIDWVVPHQANKRIIDRTVKKLGIDPEKVILTVDHHGNTSAASVPLALAEADEKGIFSEGDLLLLEAMGGGFTWGAALLRW